MSNSKRLVRNGSLYILLKRRMGCKGTYGKQMTVWKDKWDLSRIDGRCKKKIIIKKQKPQLNRVDRPEWGTLMPYQSSK